MAVFKALRITAFATTAIFSVIVMALAGHLIRLVNISNGSDESIFNLFNALAPIATRLALAISAITLAFIIPLSFADIVAVELIWTFTLEALWLSSAAYATAHPAFGGDWKDCPDPTICREDRALQAFAHMNWIVFLLYNLGLIVHTISGYRKGNKSVLSSRVNAV